MLKKNKIKMLTGIFELGLIASLLAGCTAVSLPAAATSTSETTSTLTSLTTAALSTGSLATTSSLTARTTIINMTISTTTFLNTTTTAAAATAITTAAAANASESNMVQIPGGTFAMGDHYGYVDPQHPSDELPLHNVTVSAFLMDKFDITVQEYCT
ncbi:MAG: SUMF1/EgtB/PvdO family nonheme iron enzyme, partial [Dehalococcoidales bacterium]